MNIASIVGTRPNFIKCNAISRSSFAPSSKRTIEYTAGCQEILKVLQLFEEERRTKKDNFSVISPCS